MPVSSPLPSNLPNECSKAAQIFNSFASIIPNDILRNARGFAILTIAKAGFLFSARAGSGLVLCKLPNGSWSAPSAVGTGGLGVGGQLGAELSEFVIILTSKSAVRSFMTSGSLNLGGNVSIAVGPVGRNAEAGGSITKRAAMYSYSKTRGLFGGASLEGSVIIERSDANKAAYAAYVDHPDEVTARNILSGQIEVPPWASMLIQSIERKIGTELDSKWVDDAPSDVDEASGRSRGYSFGTEFASQSSSGYGHGHGGEGEGRERERERDRDRPRDRGLSQSTRERLHEASAAEKGGTMGVGNRLRGYSLGSFGRSKSGSSTPSREAAYNGRDRANSAADPKYRYRGGESDNDDEDFGNGSRSRFSGGIDARQSVSRQSQYSFNEHQDVPPSPSSIGSASSRTQRFTEFMKRPVLPARKSTSALSTVSRPGGERSPYSCGSGAHSPTSSRARSGTLGSFRNRDNAGGSGRKGKLEFSGKYSSSEENDNGARPDRRRLSASDEDERDDHDHELGDARDAGLDTTSPFADKFGKEVEHRFSDEDEGGHDNERFGSGGRLGKRGNRSRSGTGGFSGGDDKPTRPAFGKKQSSTGKLLSGASEAMKGTTSAMKGVFTSRPMSKRSSTAPMPPRREPGGRERSDSWRERYGGADPDPDRDRYGRGSDDDEYEGYNATRAGDELDDIIVRSGSKSRDATSTEGSGTEDDDGHRRGDIRIQRPENPFAESSSSNKKDKSRSGTAAAYQSDDGDGADSQAESGAGAGALFSSSRENRDILSALDDDVSASPLAAARPRHRLLGAEDDASLRSFDSSRDDIVTFGNRAVRIHQVEDDFTDQLQTQGVPRFLKTDTRSSSYTRTAASGKELRVATFDFDGNEPGDLPFVVGDIIEVLAKGDPDWWTGRLKMREGIIPVNRTKAYNP